MNPIPEQVAQAAIDWMVELADDDRPGRHQAWQDWYAASPEHQRAWQQIQRINRRLQTLRPEAAHAAMQQSRGIERRQMLRLLGLGLLATPAAWSLYQHSPRWLADRQTGVGERRHLRLADGSSLDLNTDTALNLDLDAWQRRLELIQGEILLQVAAQPAPFDILTRSGSVQVSGTARFDLRQDADGCRLGVLEGQVTLRCRNASRSLRLEAGQQVRFTTDTISPPKPVDPGLGAWTRGVLVAADMRLDRFVAELSRHHAGWMRVAPQIAGLRVSGTYPVHDSQAIFDLLAQVLPIRITQRTRYWTSVEPLPLG